ncbi:MAG: acetyl-CoA carboxylase biotin carboxylase subunit [Rhodococcus sp. (in: high G+C Gram-positive bacteria)]|nr:MAG: acetyl-CoA carboxylase biotin carboxylase subunit [Rhodococcus sp. (in: high G+C Gram-positive bacteria)]
MFDTVLVANRGEIAVRIMRTLRRMGLRTVAVHSDVEADALHVQAADHAVSIGPGPVRESYLRGDRIIEAALTSNAQAIHPGYGLLSENAEFARAVEKAGLTFIGPSAESIDMMGSKIAARELMRAAGVPIVPGTTEEISDLERAHQVADAIGYPIAVKASGGGGGKGFRVALSRGELEKAFTGARGEGERFFGNPAVYLERYMQNPRHVEVQILADTNGNVIHLFERDCSVQRRHQKLVEESPAPAISAVLRTRIGDIAIEAAKAVRYASAGTVEGLLVGDEFYFLEMNTRIQVEHCVTEMVTGIDLVEEQVRIAAGDMLRHTQDDLTQSGHSIECRINAEDASRNFAPAPGTITSYSEPSGDHIRVDSGVGEGSTVHQFYDPLMAKVVVWGETREIATERMLSALAEYDITGVRTLIPFHRKLLASPQWHAGETCSDILADRNWLRELRDQ